MLAPPTTTSAIAGLASRRTSRRCLGCKLVRVPLGHLATRGGEVQLTLAVLTPATICGSARSTASLSFGAATGALTRPRASRPTSSPDAVAATATAVRDAACLMPTSLPCPPRGMAIDGRQEARLNGSGCCSDEATTRVGLERAIQAPGAAALALVTTRQTVCRSRGSTPGREEALSVHRSVATERLNLSCSSRCKDPASMADAVQA